MQMGKMSWTGWPSLTKSHSNSHPPKIKRTPIPCQVEGQLLWLGTEYWHKPCISDDIQWGGIRGHDVAEMSLWHLRQKHNKLYSPLPFVCNEALVLFRLLETTIFSWQNLWNRIQYFHSNVHPGLIKTGNFLQCGYRRVVTLIKTYDIYFKKNVRLFFHFRLLNGWGLIVHFTHKIFFSPTS